MYRHLCLLDPKKKGTENGPKLNERDEIAP